MTIGRSETDRVVEGRPYEPPRLTVYGTLTDLTASAGTEGEDASLGSRPAGFGG